MTTETRDPAPRIEERSRWDRAKPWFMLDWVGP